MSNILIIKHGSLGDIAQASGAIKDISEFHKGDDVYLLTTRPYFELFKRNPYLKEVILDKRLSKFNLIYLFALLRTIKKYKFAKVFDLQNSSRTSFYRKFLLKASNWSSTEIILKKGEKKKDFDNESVLKRFEIQLNKSNVKTNYTLNPDFKWACINVDNIINKYFGGKFILLFPFCSPKHSHKKWPYYNDLIKIIKFKYPNFDIVIAPASSEVEEAKKIETLMITNNNQSLNIMELAGLIRKASYVIANDTGPAHMSAHLGKKGVVLFGSHTTAKKVSIETDNFKAITVDDLNLLSAEKVYLNIKDKLELINQF